MSLHPPQSHHMTHKIVKIWETLYLTEMSRNSCFCISLNNKKQTFSIWMSLTRVGFFVLFFFSPVFTHLLSLINAFDALVLRVKWRFEVGLGLVHHSHPLQGELAAFYEVCTHLIKEKNSWLVRIQQMKIKKKRETEASSGKQGWKTKIQWTLNHTVKLLLVLQRSVSGKRFQGLCNEQKTTARELWNAGSN